MNQFTVLILLSLLFSHTKAQDKSNEQVMNPLHPSIAVVVSVLSVMFSLTFVLIAYARFCHRNPPHLLGQQQDLQELLRSRARFSGIDKTMIASLPFFRFSSLKGIKEGLECAVCLSKFEDNEILRLLPKCRHAFHMLCIDQWLESHSTCPLCRYRFDAADLTSFAYSNSMRFARNTSDLSENPNLELVVRREQDNEGTSELGNRSSFEKNDAEEKKIMLIQQGSPCGRYQKVFHRFKHKIIVSDVVFNSRWSDVNSSDLMFLNSEMLGATSSNRFSPLELQGGQSCGVFSMNEQIGKIKEDIERKRLYESKVGDLNRSKSVSSSSYASTNTTATNRSSNFRLLDLAEKRSMSEIINFSRFTEFSIKNKIKENFSAGNNGKEERIRRLWLPMARRTIQWFAGEESSHEVEFKRHISNV
ncbi:Zinc finger, RING-type [Dillenia turbinata]|uniref:RING-type E3 ubiquitin transferase n=1 Tax=Dillenia turbinata TaxID=194707 RepID=A0AAN8U992_9MAGN